MLALVEVIPVFDIQEYILGGKFQVQAGAVHYAEFRYDANQF